MIRFAFRSVILVLGAVLAISPLWAQSSLGKWQEIKNIHGNVKAVSSLPDIEVFSAPNVVMLKVNQETNVRIFTILGKLLSTQRLEPGIYEFHLEAHGVYLIKTDLSSCKIAI